MLGSSSLGFLRLEMSESGSSVLLVLAVGIWGARLRWFVVCRTVWSTGASVCSPMLAGTGLPVWTSCAWEDTVYLWHQGTTLADEHELVRCPSNQEKLSTQKWQLCGKRLLSIACACVTYQYWDGCLLNCGLKIQKGSSYLPETGTCLWRACTFPAGTIDILPRHLVACTCSQNQVGAYVFCGRGKYSACLWTELEAAE